MGMMTNQQVEAFSHQMRMQAQARQLQQQQQQQQQQGMMGLPNMNMNMNLGVGNQMMAIQSQGHTGQGQAVNGSRSGTPRDDHARSGSVGNVGQGSPRPGSQGVMQSQN